ncbi:MAG: DEAD/DEAH box helicase, partial [Candidatus Heimdallarchaeota archaeon]|nr:DEAD/DEAH box helicase [Candidatus Heimdallarchaeota archaeon]
MPIPAKISFIKLLFNKSLSQYFQRDCAASLSFNESDLEYENQLNSIGNDETYLVHSVAYVKKTPSKNILLHNGILGVGVDFFIGDDSPLNVVGNINLNNENNIIQNICPQFGIFTGGVLRDFIRDRSRGFRGTDICDVGIHCIVLESDSCSQANQTYFWEEVFTRLTGLPAPLRVSSGRRSQHAYMFLKKSLTNSEFDFMKKFIRELEYKFSDGEILKFDALKVTDKGRVPGYERFYDDKTNNILTPTGKNQNLLTTGSDSDYQSIDIIDFIKGFSSLLKPNNIYCDINPELKFLNVKHDDKDGDDNKRQPLDEYQEVMRDINFENTYSAMAHVGASHMNINDDKYQVAPDDYARGKKEKRGIIKRYADSGWTFIKSFSSKSEFCDRVNITKKYYDDIGFDLKAEVKRRINSGDTGYLNVGKIKNKPKYSAEEFTKNRYVGRETIKLNGKYIDIKWIEDNFINNPKLWILMLQAPTGAGKTTFLIALARLLNITIRAVAPFNIIKHQKYTNVYTNKEKLRSDAQKLDITDEQEVQNIMNAYGQEITDRFYCMTPEWFAHHVNVGDLVSKCKELSRTLLWFIDEFHIAHKDADFRSAYNRMLYEILHHVRLGEVKLIVASATMNKYMHLMLIKISFLEATSIRWVFFQPTDHQPSDAYLEYIPRNNEADKIIMDLKNFIKEGKRSLTGNLGKILYAFNDKTAWNRLVEAFEEKGWSDLVCQLRGINLFDSDIMKLSKHENKNTIIAKTIINNDKISPKDKITKICERQLVSENTIKMIGDIKSRIEAIDNLHHIIKNLTLSRNDQIKEVLEILTSFSKLKYNNISKLSSYTSTADLIIERLNEGKLQNLNHILYKTKLKIEISETLKYNILLQYIKNNLPKSRPSYVDLLLEEGLIEGRIMAGTSLLVEGYDLLDKDLIEIRLLVTESTMSLTTIVQLLGRFRDFRKMGIKFTIIMVGVTSNSRVPTLTGIDKQSLRILDGDGGNTMMENDALFDKTTHNGKISTLIPYSELLNEQDRMLMKNHHVLPEMLKSVGINVVGTK